MSVLDPRPCWRCAGSRQKGKEVPLEQEGMQETEHGIPTRAALSGTMLPGSNMPLQAAQGESGRQQQLKLGGGVRKPDTRLSVQSLNLATFFSLIFLKEEECSLNLGRKEGGRGVKFPCIYLPCGLSDRPTVPPVFWEAIRILENTVGSNLRGGEPTQA